MDDFQGTTAATEAEEQPEQPPVGCGPAAADEVLPVELNILDHYARQTRCVLQSLPAILGRNEQAAVILSDPWISHEHCKLVQYGGMLIVRDLDSKNGVFLHGVRVLEAEVHSGDCLTLGRTEITVRYRETASSNGPAASEDDTVPMPVVPRPARSHGPHTEELLY
jgi:pSer/pThr/pTyr-binding forkhead associated (FHA) protein